MLHVARFAVVEAPKVLPVNELPAAGATLKMQFVEFIPTSFMHSLSEKMVLVLTRQKSHLAGYFVKNSCPDFGESPLHFLTFSVPKDRSLAKPPNTTFRCRNKKMPFIAIHRKKIFADLKKKTVYSRICGKPSCS